MSDTVAAQLVGDETTRCLSLAPQQSPKESARRSPVSTRLDENVDHFAVMVNRAPEILALTVDRHEHLVQEPRIAEVSSRHCVVQRVNLTEPSDPVVS